MVMRPYRFRTHSAAGRVRVRECGKVRESVFVGPPLGPSLPGPSRPRRESRSRACLAVAGEARARTGPVNARVGTTLVDADKAGL